MEIQSNQLKRTATVIFIFLHSPHHTHTYEIWSWVLWFGIALFICCRYDHRPVSRLRFANKMERMRFTLKADVLLALVSQSWMMYFRSYCDWFFIVKSTIFVFEM